MMPLGSRPTTEVETLEDRIEARLNEALDMKIAGDFYCYGTGRGLGSIESERVHAPVDVIRLSVEDVARIAAAEARRWF